MLKQFKRANILNAVAENIKVAVHMTTKKRHPDQHTWHALIHQKRSLCGLQRITKHSLTMDNGT
jgi:hypothetical protein